ncbi:MAG TPA: radical SAM family heme chaperone HemW [Anaerolineales bacterium]|jgi:oxygen-independent coproporphyrinogen-3 oxidase
MSYSLYLHIPFCRHRCAYCDFNTYAKQESLIPAYVKALCREIEIVAESSPGRLELHTIFFGGGTPTLMTPAQYAEILGAIERHFELTEPEISTEANPGTVSLAELRELRALGINRISFGVQSANADELRMLEREHDYFDVINAVTWARRAGFDNLNLDLIYGLPLQTLDRWRATVKLVLGLRPEHLSAYALTLEHGTPFGRWSQRGLLPIPDPDAAADMYEWASEELESHGYAQYEISNWAQPGRECRHNLQYWRNLPYLGLGAGAHGYAGGYRYSNLLRIKSYIDRFAESARTGLPREFPLTPATVNCHEQSLQDDMSETMLTGLRLTREGVSSGAFRSRFGQGPDTAYRSEVEDLTRLGLLEWQDDRLLLTTRGRLLGNQVFVRFVE